jgi:ureidoacrylate peracid hydrolase
MPELAAHPAPVALDLVRTAVIVVDMQNAFASKGGMFDLAGHDISGAAGAIRAAGAVIAAARAAGVPVIYLQMGFAADLSDAGDVDSPAYHKELALIMMRERPELRGKLLVRGSWDWQIVEALRPQSGDRVIHKTRYDGFTRTTLDAELKVLGVRNLLLTGIATNICVESTARHAFFLDYWPILVADAVNAAGPDVTRQATLWAFENVFGWVTRSADVIAALGEGARAAAE